ncbi:MAG: YceI family protein [Bacteroidetes bacterium]|nr:YceI family protein [Bacteroidota bacterium]
MKAFINLVLLVVLFALGAQAQTWSIDYAHSSINFSINHYFTPVYGRFQRFSGKMDFDPANPKEAKIDFSTDIESVNTDNVKRDNDLLSAHFFDAKRFPKMTLRSTSVERISESNFRLLGQLSIHGLTRDVEIPFKIMGFGEHPVKKSLNLIGLKSEFKISRTDYGVGSGDWMNTLVVGDEVSVVIVIEATTMQIKNPK